MTTEEEEEHEKRIHELVRQEAERRCLYIGLTGANTDEAERDARRKLRDFATKLEAEIDESTDIGIDCVNAHRVWMGGHTDLVITPRGGDDAKATLGALVTRFLPEFVRDLNGCSFMIKWATKDEWPR